MWPCTITSRVMRAYMNSAVSRQGSRTLGTKLTIKLGAIYHILLNYQYGNWTIDLLRVIWSLRKGSETLPARRSA